MRDREGLILEVMDSMLASAQLEAKPGITLENFLLELEFLMEFPREGEGGKFTQEQIDFIKGVLDNNYKTVNTGHRIYYVGQGLMI